MATIKFLDGPMAGQTIQGPATPIFDILSEEGFSYGTTDGRQLIIATNVRYRCIGRDVDEAYEYEYLDEASTNNERVN